MSGVVWALDGCHWPSLAVSGRHWPSFGLWGPKWVMKHEKFKKNMKNLKKKTPMAQMMHLALFGPVVVVATLQNLLVLLEHKFNLENNGQCMKNVNLKKKKHVPWALVGICLACVGHHLPSLAIGGLRWACGG